MANQYDDLSVSIHLSHAEAVRLKEFVQAYGDESDDLVVAAIQSAIANAEKERDRQDRRIA